MFVDIPRPPSERAIAAEYQPKGIQLERYHFSSLRPGPHFVGTARIHGDEPSGELAFRRLIDELIADRSPLRLNRGKITLFPSINQPSAFLGKRSVSRDGNRGVTRLGWDEIPTNTERLIGDALAREFGRIRKESWINITSWHHGDFHDVPTEGEAHVVAGERPKDLAAAKILGLGTIITDWRKAQKNLTDEELEAIGRTRKEQDVYTTAAIHASANYRSATSFCVEGGYNGDEKSQDVAYEALRNYLAHLDILPPLAERQHTLADTFTRVSIQKTLYRLSEDETLVPEITRDDQRLETGQLVLTGGGRDVYVPKSPEGQEGHWRTVHPIPDAKVGDQFVHLAYVSDLS